MNQNPPIILLINGINFLALTFLLSFTPYAAAQIGAPPPPPPPLAFQLDPKIKVSPSMAVILVCLFSAFFVMGCVSVYVRQCSDRRMAFTTGDIAGSGRHIRRAAAARGLDPAVVDAFPMFLYSDVKGLKIGSTALECAVCLNEFESDETLRLLPKCSHVFHPDCIDAWLACHVTCPVCRANLVPRPGELRPVSILCLNSNNDLPDSDQTHDSVRVVDDIIIDIETPTVINPSLTPNQNRPPRSTLKKARRDEKFPRSYSAGHSEVKSIENYERFTLRLPEEVRSQLMNSSLIRTKSCVAFTRVRSSRKGYRSSSVGGTSQGKNYDHYERFDRVGDQSERRGLTITPPFFSRANSARSPKVGAWDGLTATPKTICSSVKSPFDCLIGGADKDDVGERSFERLRPND